ACQGTPRGVARCRDRCIFGWRSSRRAPAPPLRATSSNRMSNSVAPHAASLIIEAPCIATGTRRADIQASASFSYAVFLRQRLRDYVTLTKPRIISLLLVTTLAPMVIAARGWPSTWTVLWTMVGGYLMAGGANAINMYIDRDIDRGMVRTSLRPIPSGRMSPAHVLGFGITLGVAAFALFWTRVNPLSAVLALGGLLYYVF